MWTMRYVYRFVVTSVGFLLSTEWTLLEWASTVKPYFRLSLDEYDALR